MKMVCGGQLFLVLFLYFGVCQCELEEVLKKSNWGKHHDVDPENFDHEAILGSKKDDMAFDDATEEESEEKLKEVFFEMDLDEDGVISQEELQKWIVKSMSHLDMESARDEFEKRDQIGNTMDGLVSWEEYVEATYNHDDEVVKSWRTKPIHSEEETKKFFKSYDLDKKRFDLADVDKDGVLTEREHAAFVHPYDFPHMTQSEVDQFLSESDEDGDGKISLAEFARKPDPSVDVDWHHESEASSFREYDHDENGLLDMSELREMLAPDAVDVAEAEANHLFDLTDKDNDGKLTLEEVVNEQDSWIGSEATAFGEFFERDEL